MKKNILMGLGAIALTIGGFMASQASSKFATLSAYFISGGVWHTVFKSISTTSTKLSASNNPSHTAVMRTAGGSGSTLYNQKSTITGTVLYVH